MSSVELDAIEPEMKTSDLVRRGGADVWNFDHEVEVFCDPETCEQRRELDSGSIARCIEFAEFREIPVVGVTRVVRGVELLCVCGDRRGSGHSHTKRMVRNKSLTTVCH